MGICSGTISLRTRVNTSLPELVEKQERFKEVYAALDEPDLEKACKRAKVKPKDLDAWMRDRGFREAVLEINELRWFKLQCYVYENLKPVVENIMQIASEETNSQAIQAAKLGFEVLGILGSTGKPATVNVQTNVSVSPRDMNDEELIREHERLKQILATQKRVRVDKG